MTLLKTSRLLSLFAVFCLAACQKEASFEPVNNLPDNNHNGSGGAGGPVYNTSCNNTVLKIKKWQLIVDPEHYISAERNAHNTVRSVKMNVPLSEYKNGQFCVGERPHQRSATAGQQRQRCVGHGCFPLQFRGQSRLHVPEKR